MPRFFHSNNCFELRRSIKRGYHENTDVPRPSPPSCIILDERDLQGCSSSSGTGHGNHGGNFRMNRNACRMPADHYDNFIYYEDTSTRSGSSNSSMEDDTDNEEPRSHKRIRPCGKYTVADLTSGRMRGTSSSSSPSQPTFTSSSQLDHHYTNRKWRERNWLAIIILFFDRFWNKNFLCIQHHLW